MKIYTKKGDDGKTSLLGGRRVSKHHIRIDAYGTTDELNSHIGLIRAGGDAVSQSSLLVEIQNTLFTIGSHLARDPLAGAVKLPDLPGNQTAKLENSIDAMEEELPELRSFVLPGGSQSAAECHVARCVCRRAERTVSLLAEEDEVDPFILTYLNRLSDYLFVLSRYILYKQGKEDEPWKA